jgi:cardiolipin synthase
MHHFAWHGTGQSLLNAKLQAIATAQVSVCLEVFTFSDSPVGRLFRESLAAAARRGVRVRIIVDVVGSFGLRRDYLAGLTGAGGEFLLFKVLLMAS